MSKPPEIVRLHAATLNAYAQHIAVAETEMSGTLDSEEQFLWCRRSDNRAALVASGKTVAEPSLDRPAVSVPDGLVHDWVGATSIPGANIANTLAFLQDYDRHKVFYKPEVLDSRLVSRSGDVFQIYLRLRKKKFVTVVLDTDHRVQYSAAAPTRWCCTSFTTRVAEVEHPGKPAEVVEQPDTGYGYLWRLASYWRMQERAASVWIECRAISLTRDVPKALAWIIDPIVQKLPRESLLATLEATRRGYNAVFGGSPRE